MKDFFDRVGSFFVMILALFFAIYLVGAVIGFLGGLFG